MKYKVTMRDQNDKVYQRQVEGTSFVEADISRLLQDPNLKYLSVWVLPEEDETQQNFGFTYEDRQPT